jgi:hypothetical protein
MAMRLDDLARAREQAADRLEQAIRDLGDAFRTYSAATAELEHASGEELSRYLEAALCMHLSAAGLSSYLERKLVGTPAPLRALVDGQHRRVLGD